MKKSRKSEIDKLHFRELYSFFIRNVEHQPTSQIYFGKVFPNEDFGLDCEF